MPALLAFGWLVVGRSQPLQLRLSARLPLPTSPHLRKACLPLPLPRLPRTPFLCPRHETRLSLAHVCRTPSAGRPPSTPRARCPWKCERAGAGVQEHSQSIGGSGRGRGRAAWSRVLPGVGACRGADAFEQSRWEGGEGRRLARQWAPCGWRQME